jgi:hypothetical protein
MMSNSEFPIQDGAPYKAGALQDYLEHAGVDMSAWGHEDAKTVEHLSAELEQGESTLELTVEGRIRWMVGVVMVDVIYLPNSGGAYHLYEDRQEFRDGRVRKRSMESSIGEKMKRTETSSEAALRALQEELEVDQPKYLYYIEHARPERDSVSYPGLLSLQDLHTYTAILDQDAFQPEGYVEKQADKTNYYVWSKLYS